MRSILMCALLLGASVALATTVSADDPSTSGNSQCNNYGFYQQVTVVGDNTAGDCQAQHCVQGPSGAGAAGVGVGTTAGNGEAGATASAGTSCEQSSSLEQQGRGADPVLDALDTWSS